SPHVSSRKPPPRHSTTPVTVPPAPYSRATGNPSTSRHPRAPASKSDGRGSTRLEGTSTARPAGAAPGSGRPAPPDQGRGAQRRSPPHPTSECEGEDAASGVIWPA